MANKKFDLICIGRSCVDMYSGEFGVPLERAMTFSKSVGGSPMNIAIHVFPSINDILLQLQGESPCDQC